MIENVVFAHSLDASWGRWIAAEFVYTLRVSKSASYVFGEITDAFVTIHAFFVHTIIVVMFID